MNTESSAISVSDLTRRIKAILEGSFSSVIVQGEISNFKRHSSGHLYFTLKDEAAQISAVMWRSRAAGLSFAPQDGMKVVVTGRVTVYEVRGNYQIDAASIRPLGAGELQMAFEKLKKKLADEGLFDSGRRRPLPEFPQIIGIVTSPTGAALQDMLHVFRRRFRALTIVVHPVRVQGLGASGEIAQAIKDFNDYGKVDIIVVARGGGSLEDLWAFNEEIVARAIAASTIPVVSAVGHEIDFTIADFVADLRAPTPSAAAELVVRDTKALLDILRGFCYTMQQNLDGLLNLHKQRIQHLLKSYALNRPIDLLRQFNQRLDELNKSLVTATQHKFDMAYTRHQGLFHRVASLDPHQVLKRGYAIVAREGHIIGSSKVVKPKDVLEIRFHDGSVKSIANG